MDERPIQVSHALGYDLSGHSLDGRYQITRKIGTGGMAVVYEARRIGLDRRFAIKILRPELAEQESNVKRFLREARSAAAIEHINIVSIVDVGESSRPVYFVMEYLDGVDLRHIIRTQGRQQWPRTRERGLQIVGALAAAHARGIVHRDVKPANCFLVRDDAGRERVKVLDFGIAKVLEESQDYTNVTATHGIVGTVAYMAPEQARSGTVDKRTDVYALGTMLYEMLAGTVPFPDKNPFVALSRQLAEPPRPLREHRPDLSPEVEAIVMTCLAKDPNERFQSMEALGGALEAVAGDPVVWTGPMMAAAPVLGARSEAGSASAPVAYDHAHARPLAAASAGVATDPATLGAIAPAVRTDVLPTPVVPVATEDATPTFPLPVADAAAPVVHRREAAAAMPAAQRSSADTPVVRPASRPVSAAEPVAHAPPAPAPHGVAGLIVGAIGML
ncbi:MAG TPA: protein kinase, partial [Nannocystaceae bacterium]|nr:protein kinase [Nannocystaceae bacterium]